MTANLDFNREFSENIGNCLRVLRSGGTILYPTDTIWGIGCDATNPRAVRKVFRMKRRTESKSLIVLVDSMEMLAGYVELVPEIAHTLTQNAESPLTLIYPKGRNLAANVIAPDGSVAIRVVDHDFCRRMIREFGKPVVSTSANLSGETAPMTFSRISRDIMAQAGFVVTLFHDEVRQVKASTLIRIREDGGFEVIRK